MSSSIKFLIFLCMQAIIVLLITKLGPVEWFQPWADNRTDAAHQMFLVTDLLALAFLCYLWNLAYRRDKARQKIIKGMI